MKSASLLVLTCLALGLATPAVACPTPGAAKFKPEEVLQEAYFLDRQGEFSQAIDLYKKVLGSFPDNRKGHYLLANCYWRDGQMVESRLEWETVLRMDPQDRWGREAREWLKGNADGADASGALVGAQIGGAGFADGTAAAARFNNPTSLALTGKGDLYVADTGNKRLRKLGPDGRVSTVLGDGKGGYADGPAKSAKIDAPTALALDSAGNLFFADGNRVRFLTPTGLVGTLTGAAEAGNASGDWKTARFSQITALAVDAWGNVYVADGAVPAIRVVTPQGETRLLAGGTTAGLADGQGAEAAFKQISAMAFNADGELVVLDAGNNRLRKVTRVGQVASLEGCNKQGYMDGPAAMAHFGSLAGLAVGEDGSIFLADGANHALRHWASTGQVVTVAGGAQEGTASGRGIMAQFMAPAGLALKDRTLFVLDPKANAIRKVTL